MNGKADLCLPWVLSQFVGFVLHRPNSKIILDEPTNESLPLIYTASKVKHHLIFG